MWLQLDYMIEAEIADAPPSSHVHARVRRMSPAHATHTIEAGVADAPYTHEAEVADAHPNGGSRRHTPTYDYTHHIPTPTPHPYPYFIFYNEFARPPATPMPLMCIRGPDMTMM